MFLSVDSGFIKELMAALGLPETTVKFTLHAGVQEVVQVECWYLPDQIEMPQFKKYRLVMEEIKED